MGAGIDAVLPGGAPSTLDALALPRRDEDSVQVAHNGPGCCPPLHF